MPQLDSYSSSVNVEQPNTLSSVLSVSVIHEHITDRDVKIVKVGYDANLVRGVEDYAKD